MWTFPTLIYTIGLSKGPRIQAAAHQYEFGLDPAAQGMRREATGLRREASTKNQGEVQQEQGLSRSDWRSNLSTSFAKLFWKTIFSTDLINFIIWKKNMFEVRTPTFTPSTWGKRDHRYCLGEGGSRQSFDSCCGQEAPQQKGQNGRR